MAKIAISWVILDVLKPMLQAVLGHMEKAGSYILMGKLSPTLVMARK